MGAHEKEERELVGCHGRVVGSELPELVRGRQPCEGLCERPAGSHCGGRRDSNQGKGQRLPAPGQKEAQVGLGDTAGDSSPEDSGAGKAESADSLSNALDLCRRPRHSAWRVR